jgi:serralysin
MKTNEHRYCLCLNSKPLEGGKAALLNAARWPARTTITVKFLGGDPGLQEKVMKYAARWAAITNLRFIVQNSGDTDIRIAFQQGAGSWSYLGTQCRSIPQNEPTMNYGWLTPTSSDLEVQSVVLHEFGHAVGLIHEHQNPKAGIQWNRDAVVRDLSGPPNNWSEETIESNMFAKNAMSDVTATDTDPTSIMMYMIPKSWTLDGFSAGQNDDLSPKDIALVKSVYPQ